LCHQRSLRKTVAKKKLENEKSIEPRGREARIVFNVSEALSTEYRISLTVCYSAAWKAEHAKGRVVAAVQEGFLLAVDEESKCSTVSAV
jgi:hypothetical protein